MLPCRSLNSPGELWKFNDTLYKGAEKRGPFDILHDITETAYPKLNSTIVRTDMIFEMPAASGAAKIAA